MICTDQWFLLHWIDIISLDKPFVCKGSLGNLTEDNCRPGDDLFIKDTDVSGSIISTASDASRRKTKRFSKMFSSSQESNLKTRSTSMVRVFFIFWRKSCYNKEKMVDTLRLMIYSIVFSPIHSSQSFYKMYDEKCISLTFFW